MGRVDGGNDDHLPGRGRSQVPGADPRPGDDADVQPDRLGPAGARRRCRRRACLQHRCGLRARRGRPRQDRAAPTTGSSAQATSTATGVLDLVMRDTDGDLWLLPGTVDGYGARRVPRFGLRRLTTFVRLDFTPAAARRPARPRHERATSRSRGSRSSTSEPPLSSGPRNAGTPWSARRVHVGEQPDPGLVARPAAASSSSAWVRASPPTSARPGCRASAGPAARTRRSAPATGRRSPARPAGSGSGNRTAKGSSAQATTWSAPPCRSIESGPHTTTSCGHGRHRW